MQNEELKRTQLELGVVRTRYFELYDLAPVGYCTVSEMGLILEANLTAATLLDVSRSKLIKQPFGRIIISIGALTALAVVILAVFISRTLTRPIRILVEGAEEIGRGNLDHIVGTTTPDEIGELSRTFDRMTQALKKTTVSRDALQQKKHFSDTVIDSFPGIFYLFDEKGRFIYALDGANRMQQLIQDLLT
jgi:nitrogen fixation/metabolism regulation signal transduction histidine kinase